MGGNRILERQFVIVANFRAPDNNLSGALLPKNRYALLVVLEDSLLELATCSVDVSTAGISHRCLNTDGCKLTNKVLSALGRRGPKARTLDVVELDEVDVREGSATEICESVELGRSVVDAADHGVLVRGATTSPLDVLSHRRVEVKQRVLLDAGH